MKRGAQFLGVALFSTCLFAVGCLPYAYPKLAYVPGYDPNGMKATEVYAFRVDVTTTDPVDGFETAEWSITEIARTSDGRFPPQTRLSVERGWNVFWPLTDKVGRSHTTCVRLYSPGYQTIELDAWDSSDKVKWQLAEGTNLPFWWKSREKAVHDLIRAPRLASKTPATVLPASGPAFAFAAAEYDKLAAEAVTPEDAARLKRYAEDTRTITPQPTR